MRHSKDYADSMAKEDEEDLQVVLPEEEVVVVQFQGDEELDEVTVDPDEQMFANLKAVVVFVAVQRVKELAESCKKPRNYAVWNWSFP